MPSVPPLRPVVWLGVLGGLLAAGCGGRGVTVKGRVLDNGRPYNVTSAEEFQMSFVGGEPGKEVVGFAVVRPDGTFTITGRQKQGLPPGTYRVTAMSIPYQSGDTSRDK